ncbi:MAG TPA: acetolactate synthase 2 catalytic subunit [Candidatus Limnocylindrales bacterium]|nr:acetolactate synthase 2 catalytic subunit [Candidatus Limnocylindrales bacterium]
MKGAEFFVKALENEGVDLMFGYPGGAIMPVYDALLDSKIRHILVRHEQAAALAADGYARATGKVGVCMATSGPGATNLVTGIANAYMDSIPVVAITGQVPTHLMGTDAFQEVDIFGITLPVVKHSFLIDDVKDIARVVHEAFQIARSGRPGPVLIDLPKDVGNTNADFDFHTNNEDEFPAPPSAEAIARAMELLKASRRPVIYAGGGIGMARALAEFNAFVDATRIPVVSTLKGLGAIPTKHELFLGMMGMHGMKASNHAVQGCDLLLCIGARFDDRATGKISGFAPSARVIHMDVDPAEVGKLRHADAPLIGDLRKSLAALSIPVECDEWRHECLAWKKSHAWNYDAPAPGIYAPWFLKRLAQRTGDNTIVCCDVGQHQMWVAQHFDFNRPQQHLSSGGLGTMGFGLPAAIGAQLAYPNACVINVSGDGSMMMNLQELATLRRYDLPVKIVLFDNRALGMVRQWQELFHDKRYSEVDLSDNPDFVRVAESMGIPAFRVENKEHIEDAIDGLLAATGPVMAHVVIDQEANVWPIVGPGKTNSEMLDEVTR